MPPTTLRAREPGGFFSVGDLPDINVWLALVFRAHPHHPAAKAYWETRPGRAWFCRVTMLGLVRLLTQPRVMGGGALETPHALDIYRELASREDVGLQHEPVGCEAALSDMVQPSLPGRMMTDAYLAAFARTAGLRLVTFDRDFERFDGLDLLQLRP